VSEALASVRRDDAIVALAMAASTLLVWLAAPHGGEGLARYWDGPNYMYAARVFYRIPPDHPFAAIGLAPEAFATRLPAYPALIRACTLLTLGDYPRAMLLATLLSSVAAAVLFHRLLRAWQLVRSPLWTALLFCVLPPRWLVYHAVGATEPLFFCFVFAAFLALRAERHGWLLACIALASLTRMTGALLVPVFGLVFALRRDWRSAALVPLAGLALLALFAVHRVAFGDFFAYFTVNIGERSVVGWPPFEALRWYAAGARPHATELYLGIYALYGLGTLALWPRRELFVYAAIFYAFHAFVVHDDLSRYYLSLAPFSLLVAFDGALSSRAFRILAPLLAAGSFVYAWGVLQGNQMDADLYRALLRALHGAG
jgi:hypothetical protein